MRARSTRLCKSMWRQMREYIFAPCVLPKTQSLCSQDSASRRLKMQTNTVWSLVGTFVELFIELWPRVFGTRYRCQIQPGGNPGCTPRRLHARCAPARAHVRHQIIGNTFKAQGRSLVHGQGCVVDCRRCGRRRRKSATLSLGVGASRTVKTEDPG